MLKFWDINIIVDNIYKIPHIISNTTHNIEYT